MSKTFKSVTDNESELDVRANDCGVFIAFSRAGQIRQASTFAPSDAPALMQAIGECLPPIPEKVCGGSYEAYMSVVMTYLGRAVRALEAETAEAEAQAELEAEALELLNAHREATGNPLAESLDGLLYNAKETWLAVARRARELAKEATK